MYSKVIDGSAQFYALKLPNQTTFAIKIILKNNVDLEKLNNALEYTMALFKQFNVKLKNGFINYKFSENNSNLSVENKKNTCFEIDFKKNNNFMLYISYYENIINISFFHALTDGAGALRFTEELIKNYNETTKTYVNAFNISGENSYNKYKTGVANNYSKKSEYKNDKYFKIIENNSKIYTYKYNLNEILNKAKKYKSSLTIFYSACLNYAFCNENLPLSAITVPVNLRNRFDSNTIFNFSTSVNINTSQLYKNKSFSTIVSKINNEFKNALSINNLQNELNYACTLEQFPYCIAPNFIKKIILKRNTFKNIINLSNLGNVNIKSQFNNIESIQFLLPPSKNIISSIAMNSYENTLYVNISTYFPKQLFDKIDNCIKEI